MISNYDPDVDKSLRRTFNRCMLLVAEGHAARHEPRSSHVLRFCVSFGALSVFSLSPWGQAILGSIMNR